MSHQEHLDLINKILSKIKSTETIQDLFKKHDMDLELIQYIPICFSDTLDVSARTEKGIIYLNSELLDDPESIEHYLAHEITHVLQQTCGDGPTEGSTDDDYLDNKWEQDGFKTQTKYLSETEGNEAAMSYINDVLDYHEVNGKKERDKRKKQLLQLAENNYNLIKKSNKNKIVYHVTPTKNLADIMKNGLFPKKGERVLKLNDKYGIYVFKSFEDLEQALLTWLSDEFEDDEELTILEINLPDYINLNDSNIEYEKIITEKIPPQYIKVYNQNKKISSHQHSLNFGPLNKTKKELDDEFEQALEKGPINPRLYERKEIGISGKNKENTLNALQNLLKELESDKPKERPKLKERLVQLMLPEVD